MADITVIILTKDEEKNIERCIMSVKPIAKRIVVVDSFSKDNTVAIARALGAEVLVHPFKHYGAQFQYAIDHANIETMWVFRLDADEEVTQESRDEIETLCHTHAATDINGFVFRLQTEFMGKQIKHGFLNVLEKLCIFKFGKAYMEDRYWGEQLILTEGRSISMKSLSIHHAVRNLDYMINKSNWYSSREVKDYFERTVCKQEIDQLDRPSKIRRLIKYNVYYKLPARIRCRLLFLYWYYFRLGFLDGVEGYYWNYFETYFYRTLIDAKIYESKVTGKQIGETGALS